MDKDVSWQYLSKDEIVSAFSTDEARGLKASAVSHRRVMFSENYLWDVERTQRRSVAVKYILDGSVVFLLADLLCAAFAGFDLQFAVILLLTVLLVTFRLACDFVLERLARRGAESQIPEALVVRDAKAHLVSAVDLVPGDVVILSEGDMVCADMRVISANDFVVSEKGVTGNDIPVEKTADALLRRPSSAEDENMSNMLFAFSYVLGGSARAVCVATGDHTLAAKKGLVRKIPLHTFSAAMKRAERLSALTFSAFLAAALVYVFVGLFAFKGRFAVTDIFLRALSFAVASFGTVWHMILLFACSRRMRRLFHSGILARSPDLSDTADKCAAFVCGDVSALKKRRGELYRVAACGRFIEADEVNGDDADLREFFKMYALGTWTVPGITNAPSSVPLPRPLDSAMADYLRRAKCRPGELTAQVVPVGFVPKGAENMLDTAMYFEKGELHAVCTGDADSILSVCRTVRLDGFDEVLTHNKREQYREMVRELEKNGYYVTALAYRQPPTANISMLSVIQNSMSFAGFAAVRSIPGPMTADMVRGFSSAEHSVLCFASCQSDAVFAASEGMLEGASVYSVQNADEANALRFEKGNNYVVCVDAERVGAKERVKLCLIIIRKLRKAVGDIIFATSELSDAVFVREASVKVCLVPEKRLRPVPYSLNASADALCRSSSGSVACAGMAELLASSDESARMAVVWKYLVVSQLLRAVLFIATLFISSVIPPVVYLFWGLLLDSVLALVMLTSKRFGKILTRQKKTEKQNQGKIRLMHRKNNAEKA